MLSEKDKYQNILSQIHELNRQNLLTENERNEHIINKLSELQFYIENKQSNVNPNNIFNKIQYSIVLLIVINLILTLSILFSSLNKNTDVNENNNQTILNTTKNIKDEQVKITSITNNQKEIDENIVLFNRQERAEDEENFQEMKPIIKKDTLYTCEDDNFQTKHKIPYTVEIKGKLYVDKFMFILQNGLDRKNCKINKNDI